MISFWNPERDQIITDNRGVLPASAIANMLGCTRNAVIGRARRLGLDKLKPTGVKREPGSQKRVKRVNGEKKIRTAPVREFESPPMPVAPLNIPFIDLEERHHCREIVGTGDYGLSLSCGHPQIEASSYCEFHHRLNYTRPEPRKTTYYRHAA